MANNEKVSRTVKVHGLFVAREEDVKRYMTKTRSQLLHIVLGIYEGNRQFGEHKSHWRGYTKEDLAFIAADCRTNAGCEVDSYT